MEFNLDNLSLIEDITQYLSMDDFNPLLLNNDIFENKENKKEYTFLWKPAKSKDDQYKTGPFEENMLSSPYKYDIKIQGDVKEQKFTLKLVDSKTLVEPKSKKEAISIELVEKFTSECVIRFKINLCSFFYKTEFKILIQDTNNNIIYTSSNFSTSSRRKEIKIEVPKKMC